MTNRRGTKHRRNLAENFFWQIHAMNSGLESISFAWARMLGVNVHQWMILAAVLALDEGDGVSVKAVAVKLNADSSFITAQSKGLEKMGLLKRETSATDARVVLMSLPPKAAADVEKVKSDREPLETSVFGDCTDTELEEMVAALDTFRAKFDRVAKRLAAEL